MHDLSSYNPLSPFALPSTASIPDPPSPPFSQNVCFDHTFARRRDGRRSSLLTATVSVLGPPFIYSGTVWILESSITYTHQLCHLVNRGGGGGGGGGGSWPSCTGQKDQALISGGVI